MSTHNKEFRRAYRWSLNPWAKNVRQGYAVQVIPNAVVYRGGLRHVLIGADLLMTRKPELQLSISRSSLLDGAGAPITVDPREIMTRSIRGVLFLGWKVHCDVGRHTVVIEPRTDVPEQVLSAIAQL